MIQGERKDLIRNYEQVVENIKTNNEQLLDARNPAEFERIDPLSGLKNNIPNSKNLPYGTLFDEVTGKLITEREILDCNFRKLNFFCNKEVIIVFFLYSV